ncbi:hypothetical protein ACA910_022165 [Epithemia clementina (nom. ined.)]
MAHTLMKQLLQTVVSLTALLVAVPPLVSGILWNHQTWGLIASVSVQFNDDDGKSLPTNSQIQQLGSNMDTVSGSPSSLSSWEPNSQAQSSHARSSDFPYKTPPQQSSTSILPVRATRIVVRHDMHDVQEKYRFELDPALASGILLKSLGAGDYILDKVGPKWFDRIASRIITGRSRSAILTIIEIIQSFEDHGVVDLFGKYSQPQIFLSIVAYSGFQKTFEREGLAEHYHSDITYPPRDIVKKGNDDDAALLNNLAHYASYASAAYGWKLGFAMKGTSLLGKITRGQIGKSRPSRRNEESANNDSFSSIPMLTGGKWNDVPGISDSSFFLRKTGRKESDIVAAEWRSDTHRPGYVIVRDPSRKALVFAIRGTWSFQDVLTDLCCTPQTFSLFQSPNETSSQDVQDLPSSFSQRLWHWFYSASKGSAPGRKSSSSPASPPDGINSAHHGMLEAARGLLKATQGLVDRELGNYPDYSLVIVGHSMGGGVAALLGTLWADVFPVSVFVYGPPCIAPLGASALVGANTTKNVFSVAIDGDPFGCISLGHIAELTTALDRLCTNKNLRERLLHSTVFRRNRDRKENSWWLLHTMRYLHANCTGEKMYPPGRLLLLKEQPTGKRHTKQWTAREVPPQHFSHFQARPSKLDLSKHMPSLYEEALCALADAVDA